MQALIRADLFIACSDLMMMTTFLDNVDVIQLFPIIKSTKTFMR